MPEPPPIAGLVFRRFRPETDVPAMAEILDAHDADRGVPAVHTVDDVANYYRHLNNCDVGRDMVCADVDGRLVGYARVTWWDDASNQDRIYFPVGFLHPEWRRRGLGTALLRWNEARLREIAAGHATERRRVFESFADHPGARALLEANGYDAVGRSADMVRPHLADIPDAPLPPGLDVRPVEPGQLRAIWEAEAEAFLDHPGSRHQTEDDYQAYLAHPYMEPHLWRVAWDGDDVAGMVRSFVNREENARLGREHAYAENISVRKPWRRRGLARALLADSLRALRDEGMESAGLTVYMQNPRGALRLYESVGFETVAYTVEYHKELS